MPVQPNDTNSDRLKKSGPDVWNKKDHGKKENERDAEDIQANYGFGNSARMNTDGEETEKQEYMSDGLPRTQAYSIDKVGRSHDMDEGRSDRKGRADCGC